VAVAAATVGASVGTDVGVRGTGVAVAGSGVAVGVDVEVEASLKALETVVSEDSGVALGDAVPLPGVSVGATTVVVSVASGWPGHTVEEVVSMLRTAVIALEEGGCEVSVGVVLSLSAEVPVRAGKNATTAATTRARPAIARLWRT
jgi:hypothetical protein